MLSLRQGPSVLPDMDYPRSRFGSDNGQLPTRGLLARSCTLPKSSVDRLRLFVIIGKRHFLAEGLRLRGTEGETDSLLELLFRRVSRAVFFE